MLDVDERLERKRASARRCYHKHREAYLAAKKKRQGISKREQNRIKRAISPDTIAFPRLYLRANFAQYWEAPDGWHAAYLVWRVGPCADYTAAAMALREAMTIDAWDIAFAVKP